MSRIGLHYHICVLFCLDLRKSFQNSICAYTSNLVWHLVLSAVTPLFVTVIIGPYKRSSCIIIYSLN